MEQCKLVFIPLLAVVFFVGCGDSATSNGNGPYDDVGLGRDIKLSDIEIKRDAGMDVPDVSKDAARDIDRRDVDKDGEPVEDIEADVDIPDVDFVDGGTDVSRDAVINQLYVEIYPESVTLQANVGKQKFEAYVYNSKVTTDVTFEIVGDPGDGSLGTIDDTGLYKAPPEQPANNPNVTVRVRCVEDSSVYADASVFILPAVKVTVSPKTAVVHNNMTQQFTALVENTNNTTVLWEVIGGPQNGTIDNTGLYTAPPDVPNPEEVQIKATSVVDPSKYDTAIVTVALPIEVNIMPSSAIVNVGRTKQFVALVKNAHITNEVIWSIENDPGDGSLGTISNNGLYTAPQSVPNPAQIVIRATSKEDTSAFGIAPVLIVPPVKVTVSPKNQTVNAGTSFKFSVTVENADEDPSVKWEVLGGNQNGTIEQDGYYTAPDSVPNPPDVTIKATSNFDPSAYDTATVTVAKPIEVEVSPNFVYVNVTKTQQFTATVKNTSNQEVTWSVYGGASNGTITQTGLYTAPANVPNPNIVSIIATSKADPTKSGGAQVVIAPPIQVSITPAEAKLALRESKLFTASVYNTNNTNVTYSVVEGAAYGSVNASGNYTAPNRIFDKVVVTVRATSQADNTKFADAKVYLFPIVSTFAGSSWGDGSTIGQPAQFKSPSGVFVIDNALNVYVADTGSSRIKRLDSTGRNTLVIGSGAYGYAEGATTSAQLAAPTGLFWDGTYLYFADTGNNRIRRADASGTTSLVAGTGAIGSADNTTGSSATFFQPMGIVKVGNYLYVADAGNHRIRRIHLTGNFPVTTFAGSTQGDTDGTGTNARFNRPTAITADSSGTYLYVCDTNNNKIKRIQISNASVTSFAGTGTAGYKDGAATTVAQFNSPSGITYFKSGNTELLYVSDTQNYNIRVITGGQVYTFAGTNTYGFADGQGYLTKFNTPMHLFVSPDGKNILVADSQNHRIRLLDLEQ
ncbi:MAG: Ig-like domain-containing protein [Deltaproteobacteria bacterium]|nr:Ig-like domain-containing protein [Deltaproteobacteria bacterium]